jgi:hypothetical protein
MVAQHTLDIEIAETLERIQSVDPLRYGHWYSKLYAPHGDEANWNLTTLVHLNNILKEHEQI